VVGFSLVLGTDMILAQNLNLMAEIFFADVRGFFIFLLIDKRFKLLSFFRPNAWRYFYNHFFNSFRFIR